MTTPLTRKPTRYPDWIVADLRSDHAGETGAVMIYRGILAVSGCEQLRQFATRHLATETQHLALIEQWLPPKQRTRLLPLWQLMGWLTGALPALIGAPAVYATIAAVETFVNQHYERQLDKLEPEGPYAELYTLLATCQADEISHRDEALCQIKTRSNAVLDLWCWLVRVGSHGAVYLAKRF